MFVKVLYFYQICKRFRDGPFVPNGGGREFITTPSAFKVVYRVAGACGYIFF